MSLSVAIFFAIMAGIIEMLGRFAEGLTRKTPHDLIFNWRFAGIIAILTGVSTWLIYIIMENKIKYDIVIKFYASKQSKYILISGGIAGIIGALSSIYRDFIVSILNFSVGASMIGLAILVTLLISLKIDKRYNESIVMESNYHNQILFKSLKISLQMTFFVMFLAIIILMLFWLELGFDLRVSILILALMTCLMFMCGPHTQYVLLRLFLAHSRCAPLRLVQFLDFCSNRILLRNVGSGYLFIHRLLLEYFAALSKEDMKRLAGRMKRVT